MGYQGLYRQTSNNLVLLLDFKAVETLQPTLCVYFIAFLLPLSYCMNVPNPDDTLLAAVASLVMPLQGGPAKVRPTCIFEGNI